MAWRAEIPNWPLKAAESAVHMGKPQYQHRRFWRWAARVRSFKIERMQSPFRERARVKGTAALKRNATAHISRCPQRKCCKHSPTIMPGQICWSNSLGHLSDAKTSWRLGKRGIGDHIDRRASSESAMSDIPAAEPW